ncbi:hypothetical protein FACS189483_03690 [Spirochaetia bacterium]|nr:hypothetical protein FACS189483_03690 [Spirochaetia bacterium]
MGLYRNGDLAPHWKMPTFAEYAVGWWDTKTCHYVQMYAIWNFLKHNSLSTYQVIKDNYSDILNEGEYKQGELACYYVKLSDDLIDSIPSGVERFLKEYCKLVFSEDENEAAWNYDDYFTMQVYDAMQAEFNPLGISDFI